MSNTKYCINYNSTKKYISKIDTGTLVYKRSKDLLVFDSWQEASDFINSVFDDFEQMYYTAVEVKS